MLIPRLALLLCAAAGLTAAPPESPPEIVKVEPPNWWIGHSINPVRLLIRGRNLAGARAVADGPDLQIGLTRVNAAGTYAFVDVSIAPNTSPGPHPLHLVTSGGEAVAPFEVLQTLPRAGRFQGFSPDDIVYLIMPDRFANGDSSNDDPAVSHGLFNRQKPRYYHGGDFQGIIDHLPYLKDLGVTAIWINPVYDNVNHLNERERYHNEGITDYHGYGAVDFYGVEEHLGTLAKFRELVDAAHRQGLKVIQDQVANHTGPYHPWVKDAPTPTWFHGTASHHLANTWQTWTLIDPHATAELRASTLDGWFVDILPDLNQDDQEVARYLIQNTLWWVGVAGLDGIRQDTLPYVPRRFWRDWMAAIKREYPDLRVVGEMFDGDPALVSFFQGGQARFDGVDSGVDTVFDFPTFFAIRRAFAEGKPVRDVAVMTGHDYLYPDASLLVTFLGLHDVGRFMSDAGATVQGLDLAFTFLLTARGIPMIYYGDEIGMRGGGDPDNRRDFPGGWPEDARNAFTAAGRTPEEQSVWDRVRRLARLRGELEPLRRGPMINLCVTGQTYGYARTGPAGPVVVLMNNAADAGDVTCDLAPLGLAEGASLTDRLGGAPELHIAGGQVHARLPARTAGVYALR
ncbi:MAG TPA: alpha-amylase family glycosyl hydrolase [Bryobacteraceae bacterium]|nr:alpha-amylase family glycosyl hydrolase [Bryobacteraceae bacterium]